MERRKGRVVSELDRGSELMVDVECRVLGKFMVEAAMGNAWSGSVGKASSWRGCGMKATSGGVVSSRFVSSSVVSLGVACDAA